MSRKPRGESTARSPHLSLAHHCWVDKLPKCAVNSTCLVVYVAYLSRMRSSIFCLVFFCLTTLTFAQAVPTAEKTGDIKVGGEVVPANLDYGPVRGTGLGVFADYDFAKHLGAEFEFHQLGFSADKVITERTFEVGGRFLWPFHPTLPLIGARQLTPFIKMDVGAGKFSFQNKYENATYSMYAAGGGFDYNFIRSFDARIEYEYQRWGSFPGRGLQPNLLSFGIAYRVR